MRSNSSCYTVCLAGTACLAHKSATFDTSRSVRCLQVALNTNLTQVWAFYDQKVAFDAWAGVLRQLYMSAAALVAGWVSTPTLSIVSSVPDHGISCYSAAALGVPA
jgi:hypothetical protein